MSILAPVTSQISRITLPPVPMTSRILSRGMEKAVILGACSLIPSRALDNALSMLSRMWSRPSRACSSAVRMISSVIPVILMSI